MLLCEAIRELIHKYPEIVVISLQMCRKNFFFDCYYVIVRLDTEFPGLEIVQKKRVFLMLCHRIDILYEPSTNRSRLNQ